MSFTADFTRYTKYNSEGNAFIVRFADGTPCLATEFNEFQLIADKRIRDLAKLFGDGLMGEGSVKYEEGKLIIDNERAIVDGNLFFISHLEAVVAPGETAYLDVFLKEVSYKDEMKRYGNEQEEAIENYILDERFAREISRRMVLAYDLVTSTGETGHYYMKVGMVSDAGEYQHDAPSAGAFEKVVEELSHTITNQMTLLGETKLDKTSAVPCVIPHEGWKSDEITDEENPPRYPNYYDIPVKGITAADRVDVNIVPEDLVTAVDCGLCSSSETLEDVVRIRAEVVPVKDINAEYWLVKGKVE